MENTAKSIKLMKRLWILMCLLALASCSTSGSSGSNGYQPVIQYQSLESLQEHYELVSTDLVSTLMQLPEMAPFYTTLQVKKDIDGFGRAVVTALEQSGYGIQYVSDDQGDNYFMYQISREESQNKRSTEFGFEIGPIKVKRGYLARPGQILPNGPIKISGAKPTNVLVNNQLFTGQGSYPEFKNGVAFFDEKGYVLSHDEKRQSAKLFDSNIADYFDQSKYLVLARAMIYTGDRLRTDIDWQEAMKRNYEPYTKTKLRFRPNTLDLGRHNKRGVAQMITQFDLDNDLFQITGCYHGVSLMFDGTESKALERQLRVKEELLTSGIPIANIREDGCFGGEFVDDLDPYSVILTHRRRTQNQFN